jgi:GT2 family glycosyltransferase
MIFPRSRVGSYIFDESFFMYGEDMELCHRLGRAGGKIIYTPHASIIHYQGASMKQQQGDVLLSSLKGIRSFFQMTHHGGQIWLLDAVTLLGFGLRWILYRVAGNRHRDKARSSRKFMQLAWKIMTSGGQQKRGRS